MSLGNRHNQHSFSMVPQANMTRSTFDRSSAVKTTFNFDEITPCFVEEIIPGDTMLLNVKSFARLAPQVKPLMDNMMIDFHFFFVPMRLVWNNFQKFMGEQTNPGDSTDYLIPQITNPGGTGYNVGSIYDQFGIPTGVTGFTINALPLRCYALIYNEWFRDQNLQNSITVANGDGPDAASAYTLKKRNKRHDYFTSALPWPQKGSSVSLPLGTYADVITSPTVANPGRFILPNGATHAAQIGISSQNAANNNQVIDDGSSITLKYDPNGTLIADLSNATAATINQLREAFMMQSILELDARGGTRYVEILKAHFNVISPDFRLQRPEFLSSATTYFNQHPLTQTSETTSEDNPLGQLSAFSTNANMDNKVGFAKSFVEHGYVIGVMTARADVTYQQGLHRMWTRQQRFDFFWPKLQELGEQIIRKDEIFCQSNATTNAEPWGYQERFAEYRYKPSEIRGQFRSTYAQSLDVWHLSQEFSSLPGLNSAFIESSTPIERALVVPDPSYPDILIDLWFQLKHIRPMMAYGLPATLGRF